MHADHSRDAYDSALQFSGLVSRIQARIAATHPGEADELGKYTRRMLRRFRRSNACVGTERAQEESLQAAVWMVEALIVLNYLQDIDVARPLVTAAIEVLERTENALRIEGSLPPPRDPA